MQVIKKQKEIMQIHYFLSFTFVDEKDNGRGFCFACDKNGRVIENNDDLDKCLNGEYNVKNDGVVKYISTHIEPAQIKCNCGNIINLKELENKCSCGLVYKKEPDALEKQMWFAISERWEKTI